MKAILVLVAALGLTACQTVGTTQPVDVPATMAKACPPVQAVIATLQLSPLVQQDLKDKLHDATPYVAAACAPDATPANLKDLATTALPLMLTIVAESNLSADEKQIAAVAITIAQVALATVR